ncbi:MAG: hypothetical protein Ct9H300mP11_28260 [Chloroflexota bacterium]|nr:MAG: hypothetical protein Ct9H300mP11_28260 [Chloroflexota bacterium]
MFASLDVLTGGRIICGVGVGWLEKEFEILGRDYHQRGGDDRRMVGDHAGPRGPAKPRI